MSKTYTSTELVESVLLRAMLPKTNNTFTTNDILRFANEEISNALVPWIMQYHEDYFLTTELSPTIANQITYAIPYRAMGNKLMDVSFVDSDGTVYEMSRLTAADEGSFKTNYPSAYGRYNLRTFYLQGDEIVVASYPQDMPTGGSFKFTFYLRPNDMVEPSRCATVVSIVKDVTTTTITLSAFPDNFSGATLFDFIRSKTPYKTLGYDIGVVSVNSGTKTIEINNTDVPSRLSVGDYVTLAEESPVPQIPVETHSMLAQRVACRCLEALGDTNGLQAAMAKLAEMELKGGTILDSRVESAPVKVNNTHSFLRFRRRYPYGGV
jgi:hypothetical protein